MSIGKTIKNLRKTKNITQEKLASYLNVSCQAVSKWENGTAAPDISLIVPIANFFDVTTDVLLERDIEKQKVELEKLKEDGSRLSQQGLVRESVEHWRGAVAKYPSNYECLINLAYALHSARLSSDFGNDIETADKYTDEALEICERVLEDCTDIEIRGSAIQILVLTYGSKHRGHYDEEKAVHFAEMAPSLYVCKDVLLEHAYMFNREKRDAQVHGNALEFLDLLTRGMIFGGYKDGREKIFAIETALKIYKLVFYDGNYLFYHCRMAQIYRYLSMEYAKIGDAEKALENLRLAKEHAIAREQIPDGKQNFTSIFFNKATHDNVYTSKNFTGTELDLINEILSDKAFDGIRGTEDFINFKNNLYKL